jgi:hypothetical protein
VEVKSTRRASGSEGAVRAQLCPAMGEKTMKLLSVTGWGGIAVVHLLVGSEAGNVVTRSWS